MKGTYGGPLFTEELFHTNLPQSMSWFIDHGIKRIGNVHLYFTVLNAMDQPKQLVDRFGQPIDIANGCLFLASDESGWMTGAELVIDGGYTVG